MRHWSSSIASVFSPLSSTLMVLRRSPSRAASPRGYPLWSSRVRSATTRSCRPTVCSAIGCCRPTTASLSLVACISWACLLPQELPFAAAARLLGWQTHEAQVLSDTTVRSLVRTHGQVIRLAEQGEVAALLQRDDLATMALHLVPHEQPWRRAGWRRHCMSRWIRPWQQSRCVHQIESRGRIGSAGHAARRADATRTVDDLRHLGPELEADQVLLTVGCCRYLSWIIHKPHSTAVKRLSHVNEDRLKQTRDFCAPTSFGLFVCLLTRGRFMPFSCKKRTIAIQPVEGLHRRQRHYSSPFKPDQRMLVETGRNYPR
jgi:hypothetical protein